MLLSKSFSTKEKCLLFEVEEEIIRTEDSSFFLWNKSIILFLKHQIYFWKKLSGDVPKNLLAVVMLTHL